MIDGCAENRKPHSYIHAVFYSQQFKWAVALVVVHGDYQIKSPFSGQIEDGVGWQRPFHLPAERTAFRNSRRDLGFFFAPAKQPVFTGMRIDPAHRNLGFAVG